MGTTGARRRRQAELGTWRALALAAWAAWAAMLGAACDDDGAGRTPQARRDQAIIGGTYDGDDLAVVGLGDGPNRAGLFCTGTLIAPRVVLTAAHCVELSPPDRVYFGSDPATGGEYRQIESMQSHRAVDVALVVLESVAPEGIVPVPIARQAPREGQPARFVGFGCTHTGGTCGPFGRKFQVSAPITDFSGDEFYYAVATCNGDSGGPAFVEQDGVEVLLGPVSYGDDDCTRFGANIRVDVLAAWIDERVAAAGGTCAGGDGCGRGCAEPDPDCPCAADGLCTSACAQAAEDPDCPTACAGGNTCEEQCPVPDPDCGGRSGDGADGDDDGGCGCRVGGGGASGGGATVTAALLLAAAGLVATRRRRRRR